MTELIAPAAAGIVAWLLTYAWYSWKCEYLEDLAMKRQNESFEYWSAKYRKLSAENESLRMGLSADATTDTKQ